MGVKASSDIRNRVGIHVGSICGCSTEVAGHPSPFRMAHSTTKRPVGRSGAFIMPSGRSWPRPIWFTSDLGQSVGHQRSVESFNGNIHSVEFQWKHQHLFHTWVGKLSNSFSA